MIMVVNASKRSSSQPTIGVAAVAIIKAKRTRDMPIIIRRKRG